MAIKFANRSPRRNLSWNDFDFFAAKNFASQSDFSVYDLLHVSRLSIVCERNSLSFIDYTH